MNAAVDAGVTFFDTADVYGDGRSERLIARLLHERSEPLVVATKFGRRGPQEVAQYTYENLRAWLERSRENLGVDAVDLVQLHCPPWDAYYTPSVFDACDRLVEEGFARAYGVSVEKVEEALKAIEYPDVATVQIIFNIFRQRPAELFFEQARARDVGVIVRVPLASGLLTGKFGPETRFAADDHRAFNRHGEEFDVGETFAGVDFERGLEVVEELRALVPDGVTLAQLALALDPRVRGRLDRHPRREDGGSGSRERSGSRPAALPDDTLQHDRPDLSRPDRAAGTPALVS